MSVEVIDGSDKWRDLGHVSVEVRVDRVNEGMDSYGGGGIASYASGGTDRSSKWRGSTDVSVEVRVDRVTGGEWTVMPVGGIAGRLCQWRDLMGSGKWEGYVGGEIGDRVSGGTDGSGKWRDMSVERPVKG